MVENLTGDDYFDDGGEFAADLDQEWIDTFGGEELTTVTIAMPVWMHAEMQVRADWRKLSGVPELIRRALALDALAFGHLYDPATPADRELILRSPGLPDQILSPR